MTKIKKIIKSVPPLYNLAKRIKQNSEAVVSSALHGRLNRVLTELKIFAPTPSGPVRMRYDLTLLSAKQVIPLLSRLITYSKPQSKPTQPVRPEELCDSAAKRNLAGRLVPLFSKHGSDKPVHNYHHVYAAILDNPEKVTAMLEVGLGTNNTDVFSNMGKSGRPGASLRAFSELLPNARIYGADIDKRILFQEGKIKTFWADQTEPSTFESLSRDIGEKLDLIIDDGLHSPNANLTVLLFALDNLKIGGWLVIEDIMPDSMPVWELVSSILPVDFEPKIVCANNTFMFCLKKTA